MNQKEINDGNKLIAGFIGWHDLREFMKIMCPEYAHRLQLEEKTILYKFHSSWDWLKPVIDKIATYCLAYPEQANKVRNMSIIVDIIPCWKKVIEFINQLPEYREHDRKRQIIENFLKEDTP